MTRSDDPHARDPWIRADALLAEASAACASHAAAEVLLEARDVREAEWARCQLADRLRAALGPVRIELAGHRVDGWVESAGPDLLVVDDGRERRALSTAQVLSIQGLGPALAEERPGPERLRAIGWAAHARDLVGEAVRLHRVDGAVVSGHVIATGADHVDVVVMSDADSRRVNRAHAIPFRALAVMTSRSRMGALSRTAGSGRTSA